jgi:branched-subunit amino acid transport protein
MTGWTDTQIWAVIGALAVGTFALRLSFLGLLGRRELSPLAMRILRYTPVAVIPGLMAPLVLFPQATGGQTDPMRLFVAALTLVVGWRTGSVIWAIIAGLGSLTVLTLALG